MTDLPSGWTLAKIPNLLGTLPTGKIIDQGWSPKCENFPSNNDEKWGALKTTAIQNGWFEPQHTKQLPDHLEPKPALEVTAGDVLMTCAGPRVRCGVICRVDKVRPKLFISGKMYRFRPNEEIADGDYLLGVLRSPKLQIAIDQIKTGGSESGLNLTQDRFKSLDIPLPPLPEQRRIVRRLDALTARTTSARTHLTAIAKLVERYRAAVLRLAFSGKLTSDWRTQNPLSQSAEKYLNHLLSVRREKWIDSELRKRPDTNREKTEQRYKEPTLRHSNDLEELPAGWQWLSTEALSTKVVDGVHKKPNYVDEGIPFIMVKDMTSGSGISFEATRFISRADHEEFSRRTDPEYDDILITKDGTLGVVRRVNAKREFSIFVSVALVKPADRTLAPYLEHAYQAPQLQDQMVGVGTGLQHIHLIDLRKDCIPLAPLEEQREIVRRIEAAFARIDRLAAEAAKALKLVGHLDQRILAKAFAGNLVRQDPSDEPAETLLARIREARAIAPKAKRGRKAYARQETP